MSAPVTAAAGWQWPADVLDFAAWENTEPYLEPLLEMTRRIIPTARSIRVYLGTDPEIRDDRHIIFDVQAAGLSVPQARQAQKDWNRELLRYCPAPLVSLFGLILDQVQTTRHS
jgi:hypothetical protein